MYFIEPSSLHELHRSWADNDGEMRKGQVGENLTFWKHIDISTRKCSFVQPTRRLT